MARIRKNTRTKMYKTRKKTRKQTRKSSRKRIAGSPSYIKNTFNRWMHKYEKGIDIELSPPQLMKAQEAFAKDIINTLDLNTHNDTYNKFLKSLSRLTDQKDIELYIDFLNTVQLGDIPFSYVNDQIKYSPCKHGYKCYRTNPLHKVQGHNLDWTFSLIEQLHEQEQ